MFSTSAVEFPTGSYRELDAWNKGKGRKTHCRASTIGVCMYGCGIKKLSDNEYKFHSEYNYTEKGRRAAQIRITKQRYVKQDSPPR